MRLRFRTRRWLPSRSLARRTRGPLLGGISLHVRTRRRAAALDRWLASGVDPMLSDELSLRVGQLGSPANRWRLAATLSETVEMAIGRHAPLISTRMRLAEIEENQELVRALADRLRGPEPLGVEGLAMTTRLVDERSSPLRQGGSRDSLPTALSEALAGLDHGQRTAGAGR